MPSRTRKHTGFTLVELLVVIVIIGMLLGMLLPAVNSMREKGRVAKAKSQCAALENAIFTYFQQYGEWPDQVASPQHKETVDALHNSS